jgi:hypothetical protein
LLVITLSSFAIPGTAVSAMVTDGAWLIDGTGGAVQIFDCSGRLCGRIIWLRTAGDIAPVAQFDDRPLIPSIGGKSAAFSDRSKIMAYDRANTTPCRTAA